MTDEDPRRRDPIIEITPSPALNDRQVAIRLSGVEAHADVTIRARMVDDFERCWESRARFRADARGIVDVAEQSPLSGTYREPDPMGLFWSMHLAGEANQVGPLVKTGLEPTTIIFEADVGGETVASTRHQRRFVDRDIERIHVEDKGLVGTFFLPAGAGPYPAILVLGGSSGGLDEGRAALLASHGFAALALAYFHAEGLPDDLIDIPLEYFETALHWMQGQDRVRSDRLGAMGASRGGELVLLLGATFPQIKAVAAYVPSNVVHTGFGARTSELEKRPHAWTHGGTPVPALPPSAERIQLDIEEGEPIPLTPYFLKALENGVAVARASIPVERIGGPVLLISGEADAMWPSYPMSQMVMDRLAQHGHPYPDLHLHYADAGHQIGAPYVPTTVTAMRHPVDGGLYALGGTASGNARARSDSWEKLLDFLEENLRR
jgi:dienelactone hydrolase